MTLRGQAGLIGVCLTGLDAWDVVSCGSWVVALVLARRLVLIVIVIHFFN